MPKIRILVVDDSVVIRRMVSDALDADSSIQVVGTAPNGRIALAKVLQLNPDLITLDVEMPEMDGLETIRQLRKTHPRLPVIMFSTLTDRGATATLEALAAGANDYVTKPSNVGSAAAALACIREQLIPKIKALCPGTILRPIERFAPPALAPRPVVVPRPSRVEIVAIGVSTGGPNALAEVIPQLPATLPVPLVIVQHMPPLFTRLLAERLTAKSKIEVCEGRPGDALTPGKAWLAPGDFHMVVERRSAAVFIATHQGPPENSCRPAVDVLFRSVADVYGPGSLGIVMTGMGQDGLHGSERIREAGGVVLAQDESTSVVWGMPGFVVGAGLAQEVLPLNRIAAAIVRRVAEFRRFSEAANLTAQAG